MMRRTTPCPLTGTSPRALALQWLRIMTLPERLPGTESNDSTCPRHGELDVALTQLLHLVLEHQSAIDAPVLEHIRDLVIPWGGTPRADPYVTPLGDCLGYRIIETENHILLQETARYLINAFVAPRGLGPDYNNGANKEWLIRFMQQIVRHDFYEFNAIPYTRYQLKALFALHNYAPDPSVRMAAAGVLHWLFAKQALAGSLDRDHRPYRRRPEPQIYAHQAWWGNATLATTIAAALLVGPLHYVHADIDLQLDNGLDPDGKNAFTEVSTYPELGAAAEYFVEAFVDVADTKYRLPSALVGWLQRRFTDDHANRVTYLQAIGHTSPRADDRALFAQPNSGVELVSGNRNWTMIAGGTPAPPGDPGPPPGPLLGFPELGLISDAIAADKQDTKLWEDQIGTLRETILIPSPVGLDRSQTIRFGKPANTRKPQIFSDPQASRLCVAEGFMCGFDLHMPSRPFPAKDARECPLQETLPAALDALANRPVFGDKTLKLLLGCQVKPDGAKPVRGWQMWSFEYGMLVMADGDPPGRERLAAAWLVEPDSAEKRRLRVWWNLPGWGYDWFRMHAYNHHVEPRSGEPPGGWLADLPVVGDPDDRVRWEFGEVTFPLKGVQDTSWDLLLVGCNPTITMGINTGHDCHANILPRLSVTIAMPPKQPFSCAAHTSNQTGDTALILAVSSSCSKSPYGLFVYIKRYPCTDAQMCPESATDFGFVIAAPSRGWSWQEFAAIVDASILNFRATSGLEYRPRSDPAMIAVPISPRVVRDGDSWCALSPPSSHIVTFRWPVPNGAAILGDTGAPGLYAPFGGIAGDLASWPPALGHVSTPDMPGVAKGLLVSKGTGCFTVGGLPVRSDPYPLGLVVDLRFASAPHVQEIEPSVLGAACN